MLVLQPASAAQGAEAIRWDDLMPAGARAPLPLFGHAGGAFDLDAPPQTLDFRTNLSLSGRKIRLSGFAVPLDLAGDKVRRFLLVPYYGACIHLPPPPANQIVDVTLAKAQRLGDGTRPIVVEGTIWSEQTATALASVAYVIRDGDIR